jgi:putative transposase
MRRRLRVATAVTAASVHDRDGARQLLEVLHHKFSRLQCVWADGAYAGTLADWVQALRPYRPVRLEIIKCADTAKGFEVIPQRWTVERTLGWFNRYRRLRKDDEYLTDTSATMIRVVMIHLMVRRLVRIAPY